MLPTTYRGDVVIDGERVSGVLHLNSDFVRLALDNNQEILRWPIGTLGVDATGKGAYELRHGSESFVFEPTVDDGLGDEIALRRRFFAQPVEWSTPDPPSRSLPDPPEAAPPTSAPASPSLSERVAVAGRHSDGSRLLVGREDRFRRYLLVGSLGLILLVVIAIAFTIVTADGPVPQAAQEPVATTLPAPTTTFPAPPSTAEPVPTTAPTVSSSPPTVASATVTTSPPSTTLPPTGSVFEISPSALTERWDTAVRAHTSDLVSGEMQDDGTEFAYDAGPFVRIQGSTESGTVSRIAFVGDPSGTVNDDRKVLTGLGIVLSLVEPRLPPEGRRELLLALGFDVEDPDLAGLDNTLVYRDHTYWLRWDAQLERLVLEVRPASPAQADAPDGDS